MQEYSFPNIYRLKSKIIMDELFVTAHSKLYYPVLSKFKIFEDTVDEGSLTVRHPIPKVSFQIGFSVPKRRIRKAVHRNLIKRRMLESFRLNKSILTTKISDPAAFLAIMLIYTSNKILDFKQIEKSVIKQLHHITTTI